MSAFDPAAWLEAFEAVGGWYVVASDDHISVGWIIYGRTEEEQQEACRLFGEIEHIDHRRRILTRHVRARQNVSV